MYDGKWQKENRKWSWRILRYNYVYNSLLQCVQVTQGPYAQPVVFFGYTSFLSKFCVIRFSFHTCVVSVKKHLHDHLKVGSYADVCLQRIRKPINRFLGTESLLRTPHSGCCSSGVLPFVKVHFGTQLCDRMGNASQNYRTHTFPTYPQLLR